MFQLIFSKCKANDDSWWWMTRSHLPKETCTILQNFRPRTSLISTTQHKHNSTNITPQSIHIQHMALQFRGMVPATSRWHAVTWKLTALIWTAPLSTLRRAAIYNNQTTPEAIMPEHLPPSDFSARAFYFLLAVRPTEPELVLCLWILYRVRLADQPLHLDALRATPNALLLALIAALEIAQNWSWEQLCQGRYVIRWKRWDLPAELTYLALRTFEEKFLESLSWRIRELDPRGEAWRGRDAEIKRMRDWYMAVRIRPGNRRVSTRTDRS